MTFLASNDLVRIENLVDPFIGQDITSLDIWHPNISIRSPVTGEILFPQVRPFLALLFNLGIFWSFCTSLYIISTAFIRVKKLGRMMKFWRAMRVRKNLLQDHIYIISLIMIYRLHCAHIQIIRHYACKIKNQISINAPNLFLLKIPTTNILRSIFLLIEIVCSYHLSLFPNQTENNW